MLITAKAVELFRRALAVEPAGGTRRREFLEIANFAPSPHSSHFPSSATISSFEFFLVVEPQGTMNERRKNPRRRVIKSGTISFDRGGSLDCVVRNISVGAA